VAEVKPHFQCTHPSPHIVLWSCKLLLIAPWATTFHSSTMARTRFGLVLGSLFVLTVRRGHASGAFSVAEVKPHFQCTSAEGQQRVRDHIGNLTVSGTGLIALIQLEFTLAQPKGYTAFGAACGTKHGDPVVVLVDESQFSIVSGIRETVVGDYASMPFLVTGKGPTCGPMCVADPAVEGERGYAAAVLKHMPSGQEICVIAGTFPHCYGAWLPQFLDDVGPAGCRGLPLLFIVDTNAACEFEGPLASKGISMQDIGKNHSAGWGACSDPAVASPEPTCCHDISKGHPEARYWYDRTALCNSKGLVEQFRVHSDFVCGTDVEHKYTTAVVRLDGGSLDELPFAVYV